jgi:hypothetical protein
MQVTEELEESVVQEQALNSDFVGRHEDHLKEIAQLDRKQAELTEDCRMLREEVLQKVDEEPSWIYATPTVHTRTGLVAIQPVKQAYPRVSGPCMSRSPRNTATVGRLTPFPPSRNQSSTRMSVTLRPGTCNTPPSASFPSARKRMGKGYAMSNDPDRNDLPFGMVRGSKIKSKATASPSILPLWLEND